MLQTVLTLVFSHNFNKQASRGHILEVVGFPINVFNGVANEEDGQVCDIFFVGVVYHWVFAESCPRWLDSECFGATPGRQPPSLFFWGLEKAAIKHGITWVAMSVAQQQDK